MEGSVADFLSDKLQLAVDFPGSYFRELRQTEEPLAKLGIIETHSALLAHEAANAESVQPLGRLVFTSAPR
jgi:hypothetical protein